MQKILRWLILILMLLILLFTIKGIYQESRIQTGEEVKNVQEDEKIEEVQQEENKEINKSKIVDEKYKGYKVAAHLKIDKLKIDTCVLEDYTQNAMEVCVTKFFGPAPNEIGNFCITGHNYITKNMFGYLYTLNKSDTFTLTDNKNGMVTYKVYSKYKVQPNQTYRIITKN